MIRPARLVEDHESRSDEGDHADPGDSSAPDIAALTIRLARHFTQKETSRRSVRQSAFRQTLLVVLTNTIKRYRTTKAPTIAAASVKAIFNAVLL
jgi:hypothetical protein